MDTAKNRMKKCLWVTIISSVIVGMVCFAISGIFGMKQFPWLVVYMVLGMQATESLVQIVAIWLAQRQLVGQFHSLSKVGQVSPSFLQRQVASYSDKQKQWNKKPGRWHPVVWILWLVLLISLPVLNERNSAAHLTALIVRMALLAAVLALFIYRWRKDGMANFYEELARYYNEGIWEYNHNKYCKHDQVCYLLPPDWLCDGWEQWVKWEEMRLPIIDDIPGKLEEASRVN